MIDVFSGVRVHIVEAGTDVGKDREGKPMIVTDETTVFNGPNAWVTQTIYDKLKDQPHD